MSLQSDAAAIQDELAALRRELHQTPEIGLHLPRTQQTVLSALDGLPLEISTGKSARQLVRVGQVGCSG